MSFLQTCRLVLSLALSLLWPATAFAQTPAPLPKSDPPQVQIKVDFVTAPTADIDKSGVLFDRVPFAPTTANPAPEETFLQYATGNIVAQLFQTLIHTTGKVVQAPLITTSSNVTATFQVNMQVPDRKAGFLLIQTGLTITPRINNDASITLSVASQAADANTATPAAEPQATVLRTVRSGDMMVLADWPPSISKLINDQRLLIFVTPIIVGTDAQRDDAGQQSLPLPPLQEMSPTAGKTVSLDVYNADLRAVVALLERQTGLKASVLGTIQTYKPVYVHLNGVSLSEALGAIARSAGAQIIRNKSGVYVFSPLPGAARMPTPIPVAPADGGSSVTVTPQGEPAMRCRTLLRLAALLSLLTPPPAPAQTAARPPAAHAAGHHWRTLVLQNARPSDILILMHWNQSAGMMPHPPALPDGVRRIFALQSNNSLLVDATEEGFATVTTLVKALDIAPRQVQFKTLLVAVPATRTGLIAPDTDATRFLGELLRGERRVIWTPTVTVTDGQTVTTSFLCPAPPVSRLRLAQTGPMREGSGASSRCEVRLTPRINADKTLTLSLTLTPAATPSAAQIMTPRTLRSGELAVYDVTGPPTPHGERLFFFLQPVVIGETADGGQTITVTP